LAKHRVRFSESVSTLISRVNVHFAQINRCGGFTDADGHRLKEVYLGHLVIPRAKEILRKHFPDEIGAAEPSPTPESSTTPSNETHQDRH